MQRFVSFAGLVGLLFCGFAVAEVRDAYKIPVTLYDFHEDGTNPEFGVNWQNFHCCEATPNLIKSALTADRKPQVADGLSADSSYGVDYISRWFKPWTPGDTLTYYRKGDTTMTVRDSVGNPYIVDGETLFTEWTYLYDTTRIPSGYVKTDSCFKNVTISDFIKFVKIDNINYQSRVNDSMNIYNFFPIRGKGFEALGWSRDTTKPAFAMEIHNKITYRGGEQLFIGGDDDLWMFVNNQKVVDLGGLHPIKYDTVLFDDLGLTVGQQYDVDLFFANRSATGLFYFMSNLDFVTKTATLDTSDVSMVGTKSIAKSANRLVHTISFWGKNVVVSLPLMTKTIQYTLVNTQGVALADGAMALSQNVAIGKHDSSLPAGIYMLKLTTFDNKGIVLGTMVNKISVVR